MKPDFPIKNRQRSTIRRQNKLFTFAGFSLFFHRKVVDNLPKRWLNRMFPEYTIRLCKAPMIEVGALRIAKI